MAVSRVTVSDTPTAPVTGAEGKPADGQTPARPEGLPEKFADVGALVKAYQELETKQSTSATTTGKPEAQTPGAKPATSTLEGSGLDLQSLSAELLANNGHLSLGTMAILESKGLSKETVENYVAGVTERSKAIADDLTKVAGGQENLTQIYNWAKANMTPAELSAYNAMVAIGPEAAKMAFQGLHTRYAGANPKAPSLVSGASAPSTTGVKTFESQQQVIEAMSDPKYRNDEAYRKSVAERLVGYNGFTIRG